jgi:hypothetical protein
MKSPQSANSWPNTMKSGLADNWSEQGVDAVCKNGDPSEVYREGKSNCGRWPDAPLKTLLSPSCLFAMGFAPCTVAVAQTTGLPRLRTYLRALDLPLKVDSAPS